MTLLINRAPTPNDKPGVAEVPGRNAAGAKPQRRRTRPRPGKSRSEAHAEPGFLSGPYLLREIMGDAQLRDELNLRLEPIHVPLRGHQNAREEGFAAVVSGVTARRPALLAPRHRRQPLRAVVASTRAL